MRGPPTVDRVTDHPWAPPDPATYVRRWGLVPDGAPFSTPSSHLLPVRHDGVPAMLKVARIAEERDGARLMVWWAGRGAARVLLHDDAAIVLERALGPRSLTAWASLGAMAAGPGARDDLAACDDLIACDDRATQVLCEIAEQLHAVGGAPSSEGASAEGASAEVASTKGGDARSRLDPPPAGLVPLDRWFADLLTGVAGHDGFLGRAAATVRELLADQRDVVVLHGDLHHGNVIDFGDDASAEWRAIDPKFLVGDRAFDYTNIVCNPSHAIAVVPGRLDRQVSVICAAAGLDRRRLLRWIVAWTGLSATWYLGDTSMPAPEGETAAAAVLAVGQGAEALLAAEPR
ncbi:streptomycin 6-kinase [Sanguibacter gelidistatuariae]|uniref:Streptomycin 6-kinase n=1 Tax=Sanguibacter gelidistatuariae TaxID=1814289 RepID=A0A1G6HBH5_9MICO|nr:streptomycin 6-kinase [Sanguibacter gelidistatuariae]